MISAFLILISNIKNRQKRIKLQEANAMYKDFVERLDQNYRQVLKNKIKNISVEKSKLIYSSTASELAQMLNRNQTTSVEILLVLISRAYKIGKQLNLITDQLFIQAFIAAKKCDQRRSKQKKLNYTFGMIRQDCFPPFYGIPLSVKQSIHMKNRVTTVGLCTISPANIPQQDGLFLAVVRQMGFIPFIRSNVPQLNKSIQTHNFIFNRAMNPWNIERTPGGSSGGEGGLIASGCSVFGIGSDIGGSSRIPAVFNGLYTLLTHRYSKKGNCFYGKLSSGVTMVKSSLAPIAKSVDDIALFFNQMLMEENYKKINPLILDPYILLKPFNHDIYTKDKKLKIGYMKHFPTLKSSLSSVNAVETAIEALQKLGHKIVEVNLPDVHLGFFYFLQLFTADGKMRSLTQLRDGQSWSQQNRILEMTRNIPSWLKKIAIKLISHKQPRLASYLQRSIGLSSVELLHKIADIEEVKIKLYKYWKSNNLDLVITPGYAIPALKHTTSKDLLYINMTQALWNIVQYPVGAVPIKLAEWHQQYYFDQYNDRITNAIKQNLIGSEGLPTGIQIVGLPNTEELILNVMKQLENQINFRGKYKYPTE